MPFLTKDELYTHLYEEVVDEISRGDADKPDTAIKAAIEEARGYLTGYDTTAAFNATADDRNPILLMYVKDIAVFHFISICNVQTDYQQKLDRYNMAISWFNKVQSGKTNPNLPLPAAPVNDLGNVQNFMKWGSNIRSNTNY